MHNLYVTKKAPQQHICIYEIQKLANVNAFFHLFKLL